MTAPADLNQPNGPREPLVPLPRYQAVECPDCESWREQELDCPSCGGLRFVKVDVDSLRVWPAKEGDS